LEIGGIAKINDSRKAKAKREKYKKVIKRV